MTPGADEPSLKNSNRRASKVQIRTLGVALLGLIFLLAYLFVQLWPSDLSQSSLGNEKQKVCTLFFIDCFEVSLDARVLMLVMVSGGLGSFVHTAKSFGDFVGNDKLMSSWMWWYILKPFIGMILAIVLYLVIRGGFLSIGNDAGSLNLYSVTAMACMSGMFAKQATDKLSEVFDSLFKTSRDFGDAKRKDNLDNPIPTIVDIQPPRLTPQTRHLMLNGAGFLKSSAVRFNGASRETQYIGDNQLAVDVLADDAAKEGVLSITVFNPWPGGGLSNALSITVAGADESLTNNPNLPTGAQDDYRDGCDGVIESETSDEDLPPSTGGVAS